jgi:hypothetical protein
MTHRRSQKVPEAIVQLQQELERFRSANPTRMRLPEPLWQSGLISIGSMAIWRTAKPLRLDYMGLKKRLAGAEVPPVKLAKQAPSFVELVPPLPVTTGECVIEFESPGGAKMRIQVETRTTIYYPLRLEMRQLRRSHCGARTSTGSGQGSAQILCWIGPRGLKTPRCTLRATGLRGCLHLN